MSVTHQSPWLLSCMGGWCALRDHCPHYHAGSEGTRPSERLCTPGSDGESDIARVVITPRIQAYQTPSQEVMA